MITIKDFKTGDTVYVLLRNKGRNTSPLITEHIVKSSGRKYITLDNNDKYEEFKDDFLLQVINYGEKRLLFRTKKDAAEYLERYDLISWFRNQATTNVDNFSLDQLKKIKEIIENTNSLKTSILDPDCSNCRHSQSFVSDNRKKGFFIEIEKGFFNIQEKSDENSNPGVLISFSKNLIPSTERNIIACVNYNETNKEIQTETYQKGFDGPIHIIRYEDGIDIR